MATEGLTEPERVEYCRKRGLYPEQIIAWRIAGEQATDGEQGSSPTIRELTQAGNPMKRATLRVMPERLGRMASYSRPRFNNDNPFSEALFRTCKSRSTYPARGVPCWHNDEHRHSGIQFVTPNTRHAGQAAAHPVPMGSGWDNHDRVPESDVGHRCD